RRQAMIVAPLLVLLVAGSARASSLVCSTLGAAKQFDVLGTKKVLMTPGASVGEEEGRPPETGAVCSPQETLTVAFVDGDVVGTKATGTAIAFRRAPASNESIDSVVGGGIVTGGGKVHLTGHEQYNFLDTTGTHPDLASCSAALADTAAASSAFAALAP